MDGQVGIFTARRIISLADTLPEPAAFAVLGEQIIGTGAAAELQARFPAASLTDADDGVIVPGFNDSHIHPSIVAEDLLNLDVSFGPVRSLADLTGKVMVEARSTPPGT